MDSETPLDPLADIKPLPPPLLPKPKGRGRADWVEGMSSPNPAGRGAKKKPKGEPCPTPTTPTSAASGGGKPGKGGRLSEGQRMRRVWEHTPVPETAVSNTYREWMKKDPKGFQARMLELEAAEAAEAREASAANCAPPGTVEPAPPPGDRPEPDKNTAKLIALCDEIIARALEGVK
jgi:hypothetical protein